jgi:hypothetical protein
MNQFFHGAGHIFNRHMGIHPMLIEQFDGVDLQPLERAFDRALNLLPPAVYSRRCAFHSTRILVRTYVEAELCGDDNLVAERSQRFAHRLFV